MAKKKEGKDILEDVLNGDHDHHVPGLEELAKLIQRQSARQAPEAKPRKQKKRPNKNRSKKKTTHYLSQEVFAELADARDKLQEMLPEETVPPVSKSGIVDTALKMLLRELEEKGKDSVLYKQIIRDQKEK